MFPEPDFSFDPGEVDHENEKRNFGALFKAVVLTLAGVLAGAGPSFSAGTTVTVSGDSKPSQCGADKKATYSMELSGSLTGCWSTFVAHINCQEMNGFALYTEIGREEFAGKHDGQDIKFDTQYTFTGSSPRNPARARCGEGNRRRLHSLYLRRRPRRRDALLRRDVRRWSAALLLRRHAREVVRH